MLSNDNLLIVIISFLAWAVITYAIIYFAVKSAVGDLVYYNKALTRIMLKRMKNEGFDINELYHLFRDNENEYWQSLADQKKDTGANEA